MASTFVCPSCGSRKIGKEFPEDEDYCCNDCLEFFSDPEELISGENNISKPKGEDSSAMESKDKTKLDYDKIKKLAETKSMADIIKETGYKKASISTAMRKMGIKPAIDGRSLRYKKSVSKESLRTQQKTPSNHVAKQEIKSVVSKTEQPNKPLSELTALDILIVERNQLQEKVFKMNQAIELLSE